MFPTVPERTESSRLGQRFHGDRSSNNADVIWTDLQRKPRPGEQVNLVWEDRWAKACTVLGRAGDWGQAINGIRQAAGRLSIGRPYMSRKKEMS